MDRNKAPEASVRVHPNNRFYDSWSRTSQDVARGRHKWTVDDFQTAFENMGDDEYLKSSTFSIQVNTSRGSQVQNFELQLFPIVFSKGIHDFIAVQFASLNPVKLTLNCEFSILVESGKIIKDYKLVQKYFSEMAGYDICVRFSKPLIWDHMKGPNESISITCDFEVIQEVRQVSGNSLFEIPASMSLTANLAEIFEANHSLPFSDVTLFCQGVPYPCHKFILAARSPVFAAMFSNPMKESKESTVDISDAEPSDMRNFLRFLYTDKVDDSKNFEEVSAMLVLADKYNVEKLKISCERMIIDKTNLINVAEACHLAFLHKAPNLLSFSIGMIIGSLSLLITTEEFRKVGLKCPELLLEIMKRSTMPEDC